MRAIVNTWRQSNLVYYITSEMYSGRGGSNDGDLEGAHMRLEGVAVENKFVWVARLLIPQGLLDIVFVLEWKHTESMVRRLQCGASQGVTG